MSRSHRSAASLSVAVLAISTGALAGCSGSAETSADDATQAVAAERRNPTGVTCKGDGVVRIQDESGSVVKSLDGSRLFVAKDRRRVRSLAADGSDARVLTLPAGWKLDLVVGADAEHVYLKGQAPDGAENTALFRIAADVEAAVPELMHQAAAPLGNAAVALDQTSIYWVEQSATAPRTSDIFARAKAAGSAPQRVHRNRDSVESPVLYLRADGGRLFMTYPGAPADLAILSIKTDGTGERTYATPTFEGATGEAANTSSFQSGLRAEGNALYFVGREPPTEGKPAGPKALFQMNREDGRAKALASLPADAAVRGLAVAGADLFITLATKAEPVARLARIGKQAGARDDLHTAVAIKGARVVNPVTAGDALYFSVASERGNVGAIFRAPLSLLRGEAGLSCKLQYQAVDGGKQADPPTDPDAGAEPPATGEQADAAAPVKPVGPSTFGEDDDPAADVLPTSLGDDEEEDDDTPRLPKKGSSEVASGCSMHGHGGFPASSGAASLLLAAVAFAARRRKSG